MCMYDKYFMVKHGAKLNKTHECFNINQVSCNIFIL